MAQFASEALFFTNLWVIIYLSLLNYLNFLFPPIAKVNFYRPAVAFPERFEMTLYLLLTFLFVFFYLSFRAQSRNLLKGISPLASLGRNDKHLPTIFFLIKCFFLIFLTLLFLSKLGNYPLSNEIYPYQLRTNTSIYTIAMVLYLIAMIIIIIESAILSRFIKRFSLLTPIYYLLTTIVIAILIFEFRFPASPLEYAFFFGPIWDVIHGKTIFTDIPSQYGFLSILFFSLLFKLKLLAFSHLAIWNWVFHIIQYFICFYLIYKISKSLPLALTGLFSIITVNYFSFYIPALTIAQYGALRRLPLVLAIFLLYKFKKIDSPIFIFLLALMSFWIVDSGIQMILAYGLTHFYLLISKHTSLKRTIKALIMLFASLVGIFIFINVIHLIFGYKVINPLEIISTLRQYAISGVGMIPMETHTYFWLVILIYFASIVYYFKNRNQLILFSANISLFASLYYVGRSDGASLIIISIFPLLNLFILLGSVLENYSNEITRSLRYMLYVTCFILFIAFPAYERRFTLSELLIKKYQGLVAGNIFKTELEANLQKRFSREKELINKNLTRDEALILSSDDTYLLYVTNKKNLLDENPQSGIESDVEMNFAIKNVVKQCPSKIAIDCSVVGKCPSFTPFTKGWLTAKDTLKALETKCHLTYQSTVCTDQLCIAEAK